MVTKRWLSSVIISIVVPTIAWADDLDCASKDGRITFSDSASEGSQIQIRYLDEKTKKEIKYTGLIFVDRQVENSSRAESIFIAHKINQSKSISNDKYIMHVTHKNGEECDGRVKFEETYEQVYRIADKTGKSLNAYGALAGKKIPYMTSDGYIETTFVCHEKSFSTAGGCYAEDGDKVVWNKKN